MAEPEDEGCLETFMNLFFGGLLVITFIGVLL